MPQFAGKNAVIVGASSGIGAAIGVALARHGARVTFGARRRDQAEQQAAIARASAQESGSQGHAQACRCDLTNSSSISEFLRVAASEAPIDMIVNAAAVLYIGAFSDQAESDWRAMIDTNLSGAIALTQASLREMLPKGHGHIVHVTSTTAAVPIPHLAVYSVTKAALSHFLAAMRGEYGTSGVRFTELQIGNTGGTEAGGSLTRPVSMEAYESLARWTGVPTVMNLDEVVQAALWALSTPTTVRLDKIVLREPANIPL